MMKLKLLFCLIFTLFFLSVSSVNGQTAAQKNKLEKSLKAAGYNIKNKSEVEPTDWEKTEFNLQSKYRFIVKSTKHFPGVRNTFARYEVEIEVFNNKTEAENRLKRLREVPPGFDDKMHAEYVLRDGFQRRNLVYIISTDAVMFSYKSLSDLKTKLEKAI